MNTEPRTGSSSLLIEWANAEAGWVRMIVSDMLTNKSRAKDGDVDRYFEMLLSESNLRGTPASAIPLLPQVHINDGAGETLVINAMTVKSGINALKDGQALEFGSRLTVICGENGSGKSGYVRVLKRAAGVRSAERILGNVRLHNSSTPSAEFTFTLDGQPQPILDWRNEERVAPLSQSAVFDARASDAHVDDELSYVYTPGELALFPLVQDAIDRVRLKLTGAVALKGEQRNAFIAHFRRGSRLFSLIETLGAATDLDQLKRLAALSDAELIQKTHLETEVESLKSSDLKAQHKVVADQLQLVRSIVGCLKQIDTFDHTRYLTALQRLKSAVEADTEVNSIAFVGAAIPGALTEPWRRFIDAAEEYSRSSHQSSAHGDPCIYCRQPLLGSAAELIAKYKVFASGAVRNELDQAQRDLNTSCDGIATLALDAPLNLLVAEVDGGRGPSISFLRPAFEIMGAFKDAITRRSMDLPETHKLKSFLDRANATQGKLAETETGLRSRAQEREQLLARRENELLELQARLVLKDLLPSIEQFVQDAKWANSAALIGRGFTGILRSLTDQAKVATEALLNSNFEQIFVQEAAALRAPTVVLQFPGSRGQTLRRKVVGDHRPSEVLSEGEQKVIALADFLAETRVRQPQGPVIFDDPVNSLDYRRVNEVADRLLHLAESRQVIVFTHSVMFASMLLAKAPKKHTSYIDIKNDGAPGIASVGTHPRTDTVSDLTKRIQARITAAKTATGETQAALLESSYNAIRAFTEVLTERGLLRAITARYRANVRVDGLDKLNTTDMSSAITTVVEVYSKACRYTEAHSQPIEHLDLRPTVAELESDYAALQEVHKAHPCVE